MNVRTLIAVLLFFIVIIYFVHFFFLNEDLLSQTIQYGRNKEISVLFTLFFTFVLGVTFVLIILGLKGSGTLLEMWRRAIHKRKFKKLEETYFRGIELLLNKNYEGALGIMDAVLTQDPNHYQALMKSGEILRSLGRYGEASERHSRAAGINPGDFAALLGLVEDYRGDGKNEEAIQILDRVVELHPKQNLTTLRLIRDIKMEMGLWDDAAEVQEKIQETTGDNPEEDKFRIGIRYQMGCKKIDSGLWKEAVHMFRNIIKSEPDFAPAYLKLAACHERGNNEDEAVRVLSKGYEVTHHPIFLTRIEQFYLDREEPNLALEHLGRIAVSSRKDLIPRFVLGKLYRRLEMLDAALEQFNRILDQAPHSPTLHYHLGRIHERKENYEMAAAEYRKVVQVSQAVKAQYLCNDCGARYENWLDRCQNCGKWNTIDVDLNEEVTRFVKMAVPVI
jgi:tetratricopeptide (TPR) repeat protein